MDTNGSLDMVMTHQADRSSDHIVVELFRIFGRLGHSNTCIRGHSRPPCCQPMLLINENSLTDNTIQELCRAVQASSLVAAYM